MGVCFVAVSGYCLPALELVVDFQFTAFATAALPTWEYRKTAPVSCFGFFFRIGVAENRVLVVVNSGLFFIEGRQFKLRLFGD